MKMKLLQKLSSSQQLLWWQYFRDGMSSSDIWKCLQIEGKILFQLTINYSLFQVLTYIRKKAILAIQKQRGKIPFGNLICVTS